MKQQTKSNPKEQVNDATVNFIKNVCTRIAEALDEITSSCTEEPEEKYKISSLGHSQGIGLFLYIKQSQQALKNKFPAFTENEIMSILIAKWQNLSQAEKTEYYAKFNVNQFRGSKKLKKLDKMAQKFSNSLHKQNIVNQQKKGFQKATNQQKNALEKSATNIKYLEKVQALQQILEEQDCDHFFDESQQQKPSTPIETTPFQSAPIQTIPIQATPLQTTPIQTTPIQTQPCKIKSVKLSFHPTASISIQPKTEDRSNQSMNLQQILQTQEQITENQSEKLQQIPIIESHQEEEKKHEHVEDDKNKPILPQKQQNIHIEIDASIVAVASNNSNEISMLSNSMIGKEQNSPQSHESKENNNLSSPPEQSEEQSATFGLKNKDMDEMKCFEDNASASSNDWSQKSLQINSKNDNQSETPYFQAVSQAEEHLECQKLT